MTLSRRDALRLAAGFGAAAAVPFAVSPDEAAALLDQPAEFDPGGDRGPAWGADLLAPVQFAESLDGIDVQSWFEHGAPEDMAAYKQAFADLLDLYPELIDPTGTAHPITRLDEAALGLWVAAWLAGIRAGAAYEHLRLALVAPRQACARCHGHGRTWGGSPYRHRNDGANAETCRECGGAGTVPTPAPRLHLTAD